MTKRRFAWLLLTLGVVFSQARPAKAQRPAEAQRPAAGRLRVVTFNTAMGLGAKLRSERGIVEFFEHEPALSGAHVLSLQEVCLNDRRQLASYLRVMQHAHHVQYHYADYASKRRGERCDKGQAIVSAFPIVAAGTLQLR